MNARERFLETMKFNTRVRVPKWEYAFWGLTIKRWYAEGLPERNYPVIPTKVSTINYSLYTTAYAHEWEKTKNLFEKSFGERERKIELPDGIAVWGGGVYWPTQGLPRESDVTAYFGMDKGTAAVNVEHLFCPRFEARVLEDDEDSMTAVYVDGVTRIYKKAQGVIPSSVAYPIKDWDSWLQVKGERLRIDHLSDRFPQNWLELVEEYNNRDYPLALGGYPCGFFGTLAHLLGYENLFFSYYDAPDLLKDMLQHLTNLWIAIWEEVLGQVDVDMAHIWEDVSWSKGSMVSPGIFKEFMAPFYKQITSFLKGKGVEVILVDTDGDCRELIPLFLEAGVTGLYPMEVSGGMDVVAARKAFPQLQMMGGVPKLELALGEKRIVEVLEPVNWLLSQGGYIPFADHSVPPEVPWKCFKSYREKLNEMIDHCGAL
jgi:uroporphyrinogen decarboxylase